MPQKPDLQPSASLMNALRICMCCDPPSPASGSGAGRVRQGTRSAKDGVCEAPPLPQALSFQRLGFVCLSTVTFFVRLCTVTFFCLPLYCSAFMFLSTVPLFVCLSTVTFFVCLSTVTFVEFASLLFRFCVSLYRPAFRLPLQEVCHAHPETWQTTPASHCASPNPKKWGGGESP